MTATPRMLRLASITLLPLLLLAACSEDGPRCPAGGPVSEGCACGPELACKTDLVCDGDTSRCREALACDDLVCGEHQACEGGSDSKDSLCAESCDPGWIWDLLDKACEAAPPTCEADEPTSIATDCEEQHRDCLDYGDGARCGSVGADCV